MDGPCRPTYSVRVWGSLSFISYRPVVPVLVGDNFKVPQIVQFATNAMQTIIINDYINEGLNNNLGNSPDFTDLREAGAN